MASSRLRKAFKYPSDDSDDGPDELDEEHQEELISQIQAEDARKNTLYRKLFLAIPLAGALILLSIFLTIPNTPQQRLILLLSISSLSATAYILHFMPLQSPDWKGKKAVYKIEAEKGPVERYLVALNAVLAGLLLLAAGVSWWVGRGLEAWREAVPGVIFGLTMLVRRLLAPLDLRELEGARYELKGA
ncbi:hypothetical protein Tdes44962_MAKER05365 [Teratosphaeria destructans]|uniref:Transmembrane protein n=1 Tax=Teratosphaeria destructans TaxID=418781 RepID=A0A9W7SK42_9PEZI|nr:hypothetical protein Tdes44962_MAKER05365 [Teratosphaeria destructans]